MENLNLLKQVKDHEQLAVFFGYGNYKDFARIVYGTPDKYKYHTFEIPKRNGDKRTIESPNKKIKSIQRKLLLVLQEAYKPHPCAYGFIQKKNIVQNASKHLGRRFIFNIDLESFFHSIHFGRIRGLFQKLPFELPPSIAVILANICCFKGRLPQGAPTSPLISNLIAAHLDKELFSLARKFRCSYSRYADDISFSFNCTKGSLPSALLIENDGRAEVGNILRETIEKNGFKLNASKIRLCVPSKRLEVTGLTLNVVPNVPRRYVRKISSILNAWEKYGLSAAEKEHFKENPRPMGTVHSLERVIHGKLLYLKMVRGSSNPIYVKFAKKFNSLNKNKALNLKYIENYSILEILSKAVMIVEIELESQGSAFFLNGVGLVTCYHVIEAGLKNKDIKVNLPGKKAVSAEICCYCKDRDIAILQIEENQLYEQMFLEYLDVDVRIGMEIILAGYPSNSSGKSIFMCASRVGAKADISGVTGFEIGLQIRQGNSGGPVLSPEGKVLGIAAEGSFGNEGHNRVIHISEIFKMLEEQNSFTSDSEMASSN